MNDTHVVHFTHVRGNHITRKVHYRYTDSIEQYRHAKGIGIVRIQLNSKTRFAFRIGDHIFGLAQHLRLGETF